MMEKAEPMAAPKGINAERFFDKLPMLAIAGDEQSVDRIAYELLNVLMQGVDAAIGQISLLPRGGRIEKVCIIKEGRPWLREDMHLHLYNPSKGFAGQVTAAGKTLMVADIWAQRWKNGTNPFLEIQGQMDPRYVQEIKRPVASTIFLPIKRESDIFCMIELSRYRGRPPFDDGDRQAVDEFAAKYGSLIINYIVDTRSRMAINTAHHKLNNLSRLIASNAKVDYADAVAAYRTLSSADLGFAFFRRGSGYQPTSVWVVAWHNDEVMEIFLPQFAPSADSVLCDSSEISYPIEGDGQSARLLRFRTRIEQNSSLKAREKQFLLNIIDEIRSFVVYPLHMLNQDLGAVQLASSRNDFCRFLHTSPFLSLYNALLKSFLLNERIAEYLSEISLKVHNPGFYCMAALKAALIKEDLGLLSKQEIKSAFSGLENLLNEVHDSGKLLKCRERNINFRKWLQAYVNQKRSQYPNLQVNLQVHADFPKNLHVHANYEHLETIFENLFVNSLRAINQRQNRDSTLGGRIDIGLFYDKNRLRTCFQDNGSAYETVSGRGTPQMKTIMRELGGSYRRYRNPYRVYLTFPSTYIEDREAYHAD